MSTNFIVFMNRQNDDDHYHDDDDDDGISSHVNFSRTYKYTVDFGYSYRRIATFNFD